MKKLLTLFMFLLFLTPYNKAAAQIDSIAIASTQWSHFGSTGQLDSALYYAKEAEKLSKNRFGELSVSNSITQFMIGMTYQFLNDFIAAYPYYKKSIATFEAVDSTKYGEYRQALLNCGIICLSIGHYEEAEKNLTKCNRLSEKKGDLDMAAQSNINLAVLYSGKGEYAKAELLYASLQEMIDTLPKNPTLTYYQISVYNNIAEIMYQTGEINKALSYMKKAEHLFKASGLKDSLYFADYIEVLTNLAEAYTNVHKIDSANLTCNEAEDELKNKKEDYLHAELLKEKMYINQQEKNLPKAIILAKKCLKILEPTQDPRGDRDAITLNLALLYSLNNQYRLSDSIIKLTISKLSNQGLQGSFLFQQAGILFCKNLIYQNKYNEAFDTLLILSKLATNTINKNFAGMTETDQLQLSAGFDVIFDMLYTLLAKKNNLDEKAIKQVFGFELQRKNLVLGSQTNLLMRMRNAGDSVSARLFSKWVDTRQLLAAQYSMPVLQRFLNTDSIEEVSDGIEQQMSAKGIKTNFVNNGEISRVFRNMEPTVANIEFVRFNCIGKNNHEDSAVYAAFVIKGGDASPSFVPLCSEKALLTLLAAGKGKPADEGQLTQKLYTPASSGATLLYKLIWQPLEKHLTNISFINYSAAGLLNNISFHALNNSKGYLTNSYTIRRFSNLDSAKTYTETSEQPQAISVWGNINYDSSNYFSDRVNEALANNKNIYSLTASSLAPATQVKTISKTPLQSFNDDEITPLKKLFTTNKIPFNNYKGSNATEENFKLLAPTIKGILHISTHGFYSPFNKDDAGSAIPIGFIAGNANPLFRCGIAFSGANYYWLKGIPKQNHEDGILTGYEAAELDLHNVQLVTLSACETGLGDVTANEGNIGMQRAFKLAGAKKLLVSLWQVPAKQTQQLLTKFYTYWLQNKSLSKALQLAETDMQKQGYPPYYWAGFVLVE